jgi:hypothetical protein
MYGVTTSTSSTYSYTVKVSTATKSITLNQSVRYHDLPTCTASRQAPRTLTKYGRQTKISDTTMYGVTTSRIYTHTNTTLHGVKRWRTRARHLTTGLADQNSNTKLHGVTTTEPYDGTTTWRTRAILQNGRHTIISNTNVTRLWPRETPHVHTDETLSQLSHTTLYGVTQTPHSNDHPHTR